MIYTLYIGLESSPLLIVFTFPKYSKGLDTLPLYTHNNKGPLEKYNKESIFKESG